MPLKNFTYHLRFAAAQNTIIYKNAGELAPNGFVQQGRRDARIDTTAQAKNHFFIAYLSTNVIDRLADVIAHRPFPAAAADVMDEIADDLLSSRRVHYLRMKLQTK